MLKLIFPEFVGGRSALGLLLIRAIVGIAFILHGWPKVTNIAAFSQMADIPVFLGAAAALSEFVGGILLVVGLGTPVASFLLCVTMAVAYFMVHFGQPFVAGKGGPNWELAGVYFFVNLGLLLLGPGRYSADARIFARRA